MQNLLLGAIICWTLPRPMYIMMGSGWRNISRHLLFGAAADSNIDRFWQAGPEWIVLRIALLAVLVTIACYVIGKIRPKPVQKEHRASQWLSKYRELHSKGKLTDEEFRTIKTTLAAQLQDELNDNGEKD